MPEKRVDHLKGLVHPGPTEATVLRYLPSERFVAFVEHYWIARWHITDGSTTLVELTYPSVQVVVECHGATAEAYLAGVITSKFTKHLEGDGYVLGIKFRPGGFYPFVRTAVATFSDRRLPLQELFGAGVDDFRRAVQQANSDEAMVALAESFLSRILPKGDAKVKEVTDIIDWVCANREVTRVDEVVAQFALSPRALQRLFQRYVGVPPKWVIQRYRLLDAVEELPSHKGGEVGRLAADLGYFDQAHFARDFKTAVGTGPADYARRSDQT
jgi:AraC-like DNA-binding protein